jgi:hypothetical protein
VRGDRSVERAAQDQGGFLAESQELAELLLGLGQGVPRRRARIAVGGQLLLQVFLAGFLVLEGSPQVGGGLRDGRVAGFPLAAAAATIASAIASPVAALAALATASAAEASEAAAETPAAARLPLGPRPWP